LIRVNIDSAELERHLKTSPARATWASREAFLMAGGHFRKKLKADIEGGKISGPKSKHPVTVAEGPKRGGGPVSFLGRFVRFTVGKSKGLLILKLGFLPGKIRFKAGDQRITIPAVAKIHEFGKRFKVTAKMKRFLASIGYPIKRATRYFTVPARPMIEPFYNREKSNIPGYVEKRFFEKFFGNQRPDIRI